MVVPARAELDRLQLEAGNAGGDVQSGLALHAERLQRVGVGGPPTRKLPPPPMPIDALAPTPP